MSEPVDIHTFVSPALHPSNAESIEGYEANKPYLAGVLESLSTAYEGLADIHKARLAGEKNPTRNDAGKLLIVGNYAEKVQLGITRKIDKTMSDLNSGIESMESMLNTPMKSSAATGSIPNEIRAHAKALSLKDRGKFLTEAQARGDTQTLSAILGAPGYLSGVGEAEMKARTRQYHEHKSPEITARLQAMKAGRDLLMKRSALVFKETEKAIGAPWSDIHHIRNAKNTSDKLFAVGVE